MSAPHRHRIALAIASVVLVSVAASGALTLAGHGRRLPGGGAARPAGIPSEGLDPAVAQAGGDSNWWSTASAGLLAEEYCASVADGALQAPNRAQNLRTRFAAEGIAIEPRVLGGAAPVWRFGWETAALGRPGQMSEAAPAVLHAAGARV
ncbi:MAG TPA: hypothetical protein VNM87_12290, partial [Candidatus Udaeobacter sp.]|nr:hypothetical protein [Candidatus Udaeobacter sp.]